VGENMQIENYEGENKPVEGFAQLYEVYQMIVEDVNNITEIQQKLSTMNLQALLLLASLTRSPVLINELYKLYKIRINHSSQLLLELARNPVTPSELLNEMSYSIVEDLIVLISVNSRTPQTTLQRLCTHDRAYIRKAVAGNPSLPIETLQELLDDPNSIVVSSALKALQNRDDSALHGIPQSWVRKILS
jgi:hypothetical protein